VQTLSDLEPLTITSRMELAPGAVLVASPKQAAAPVIWSRVVKEFDSADDTSKKRLAARFLPNRNSISVLKEMPFAPNTTLGSSAALGHGASAALGRRGPGLGDLFRDEAGNFTILDPAMIAWLESEKPELWVGTSAPQYYLESVQTIPVDSAVMIGSTIDLTDIELVIRPNVSTLYLIAERLVCGDNASITWADPGGVSPPRQDNAGLNGADLWGTNPEGDGWDGEDGSPGLAGVTGAAGLAAPSLEIWVKEMSAMPNIDLNGEDGRNGGRGQRGGDGGRGADGAGSETRFHYWCGKGPGDGGNGGWGGNGGPGGQGGKGGKGGTLTIAVLENTLEATLTSRVFRIKNQGGQPGRGGPGGIGGAGGAGGTAGNKGNCSGARDGQAGGDGQPGAVGRDSVVAGIEGEVHFLGFTVDEWDAQLTRPWLADVAPGQVFPGDSVTLRGSRFGAGDKVIISGVALPPAFNADGSILVDVPPTVGGGITSVFVLRQDGAESNRFNIWIKPQLDPIDVLPEPGNTVSLTGRAFVAGAGVLVSGAWCTGAVRSAGELTFAVPDVAGRDDLTLQVRNPDGMVSNIRFAQIQWKVEIGFAFGVHNLPVWGSSGANFTDGVPDWGTFKDTFGSAEVWHEQLDPFFGHPMLTAAFFAFYYYFLKGEANGGLASGFCTALAGLVADNFWQGRVDTHSITKASVHRYLTAKHGKLLSKESLIQFHSQGREGVARVEATAREVETIFLRGCDRDNAPLIFFIPSGDILDSGYFAKLGNSHCVMPYRFSYPLGHPRPRLSPDRSTTITDLDGVSLYVWDCNHPDSDKCKLVFKQDAGELKFEYFSDPQGGVQFSSDQGITLGMMTNGRYMLADHAMPFSGPLGVKAFILDFVQSPADLQVQDASERRTGNFDGQIFAQIPDSHPCYLIAGAYLLPPDTALTRRIVGTGAGSYTFNSIMPAGGSLTLEAVPTALGQVDVLSVNADATRFQFTPATEKTFSLTLARQVGNQARGVAIRGVGGAPGAEVDMMISPELSMVRIGNRGGARNVEVRAVVMDNQTNAMLKKDIPSMELQPKNELTVTVQDWTKLDARAHVSSFD
jgi:hypothetical protein